MSVFTYNGITLPYAFNTQFRQEAVYDELSNTDWVLTKFDVETQAVITASYMKSLTPDYAGADDSNAAEIMKAIRVRLLTPRRQLILSFNGIDLIPQNNLPGTVDARNGPQPQHCIITALNNSTFLLSYRVIGHYWENDADPNGSQNNPVLWNRWEESVDIDMANFTTRTRSGTFVIRSDNSEGKIADQLRTQMAVVGVPSGFIRQSSRYTVRPDGLAINYAVVDREQFKMPPFPAFKAAGRYTESTTMIGGINRICEVQLSLEADKLTSQALLLSTACAVATGKLRINGAPVNNSSTPQCFLLYGSMSVNMYENKVDVMFRVQAPPRSSPTGAAAGAGIGIGGGIVAASQNGSARVAGIAGIRWGGMVNTPFSDGVNYQPPYLPAGTADILLRAAAYYDPSLQGNTINPVTGQMRYGAEVGRTAVPQPEADAVLGG